MLDCATNWVDQALWCLARGQQVVLITVARARGSTPREAGARMLVSASEQWLTIGGGNLEWQAIKNARAQLAAPQGALAWLHAVALGPSLGQCCGGHVDLLLQRLRAEDTAWLQELQRQLPHGAHLEVFVPHDGGAPQISAVPLDGAAPGAPATSLLHDCARGVLLREQLRAGGPNIVVFGAGHVGRALVRLLLGLPCRITWVDERAELLAGLQAAKLSIEATDSPEAVIDAAPPGSSYVILTHDHALDQRLCEYLLRRGDFAYLGLIGSLTKRNKFAHRLQARGISAQSFARVVCPIGVPGIGGKQPEVIALATAAQLMQRNS